LAQATDYLKIEKKLSSKSREMFKEIRNIFPILIEDRTHYQEIEKIIDFLRKETNCTN